MNLSTIRAPAIHCANLTRVGLAIVLASAGSLAQDGQGIQGERRSDYERLVVNADGSLVYVEPLDTTLLNRLEYTNRLRPTLEIFLSDTEGDRRISILDYDHDAKPDFMRIERTLPDHTVEAVSFYRGPMHKLHEQGHLEHALQHSFIRNDSSLAREIRGRLDAMEVRTIDAGEIGVFSGYSLFAEIKLPIIGEAFRAADSLYSAIQRVTSSDVQSLREVPEIGTLHRSEIQKLLSINPHTLGMESEGSRPR